MWSMKWLLFLVNENRGCMLWDKIFPFECKLWVYACWYVMLVFLSVTCAYLTLPLKSWLVGCLHLMVMVVDAFDSVQFRLGGEINRLQLEMTCLRAELDGSEARFVAASGSEREMIWPIAVMRWSDSCKSFLPGWVPQTLPPQMEQVHPLRARLPLLILISKDGLVVTLTILIP